MNNNWDTDRIRDAVDGISDFSSCSGIAESFALDTLTAFADMGDYAAGYVCEVAQKLTEGENVNGSWYCSRYKAEQEVFANVEFFEAVAEYEAAQGLTENDEPMFNLFDIEREHCKGRIIGNEILFAGLYSAFCDYDENADRDSIGDSERAHFIAYYKGAEWESEPDAHDIAADISRTYDLIFNNPVDGVKVARVCSGSFNRAVASDTWHCKLTLDSGAEYIVTHWDNGGGIEFDGGEEMKEAFYILETLDKTESEKGENVTTADEAPAHFGNVLTAFEFVTSQGRAK